MHNLENAKDKIITETINMIVNSARKFDDSNTDAKEREKLESNIVKLLGILGSDEDICKSYPEISQNIYNLNDSDLDFLKIFFGLSNKVNLNEFSGFLDGFETLQRDKVNSNLRHFEKHIKLSCYQRDYMDSISKSASKRAEEIKRSVEDTEDKVKRASNNANMALTNANEAGRKIKKAVGKVKKVYSEFVGILGVFTALSFAMMGSVQVLSNLLNNIKNPSSGSIGYVFIVGGVYLLLMYLLIMTLFIGMKKIFSFENEKYSFSNKFVCFLVGTVIFLVIIGLVII